MIVTKDGLKYDGDSNPIKLSLAGTYSTSENTVAYAEGTICNEIQSVTISSFRVAYTDSGGKSHDDYHPNVNINGIISEDDPMKVEIVLIQNFLTITITASQENCFKIAATFDGQGYSLTSLSLGGTITYLFDNLLKIEKELTSISKNLSVGGDVSIGGSLTVPSDKGIEVGELAGGSIDIGTMTGGSIDIDTMTRGSIRVHSMQKGYIHITPANVEKEESTFDPAVNFDFNFGDNLNVKELDVTIVTEDGKAGGCIEEAILHNNYYNYNDFFFVVVETYNDYTTAGIFYLESNIMSSDTWRGTTAGLYHRWWSPMQIEVDKHGGSYYFFPYKIDSENTVTYYEEEYLKTISLYKLPITAYFEGWKNIS